MEASRHELGNGQLLLIREETGKDAGALLNYIVAISAESDFLTFGPGEFELTVAEEAAILSKCRDSDNQIFLVGLIADRIVSALHFSAGVRARVRHTGKFGLSGRKQHWGQGIGSLMLDALIAWARATGIVTKINLRVRADNRRAILLYEGKGFVTEGTISRAICLDGEYYNHRWMGLEL